MKFDQIYTTEIHNVINNNLGTMYVLWISLRVRSNYTIPNVFCLTVCSIRAISSVVFGYELNNIDSSSTSA